MDSFSRDIGTPAAVEPPETQRARKRDSLFLTAQLKVAADAAAREVRIRNLSEGGLMAEYERAMEPGAPVWLELRGIGAITGKIAWYTEGRMGIVLDSPIDPKRARKPVGQGGATPFYAKAVVARPRR